MKIFLIADTHFNHDAIIEFEGRPSNYMDIIKKKWNHLVGENDLVIHLGDVIFKRASELKDIMESLNGRKWLVRGNHDKENIAWYLKRGFDFAADTSRAASVGSPITFSFSSFESLHNAPILSKSSISFGLHEKEPSEL